MFVGFPSRDQITPEHATPMTQPASEPESDPTLAIADIEQRQDDAIRQLDELNERVENLIELYTRLRNPDSERSDSNPSESNESERAA